MRIKKIIHFALLLAMFVSIAPLKAQAQSTLPPADMFQLPWEQGKAWVAFDGLDNGIKRPSSSPHNYKTGGAIDFAPRPNMQIGEDTSNDWVTAAAAGTVIEISFCHLKLDHGNGWISEYWHLDKIQTNLGQKVSRNQRLGIIHNNKTQRVCLGNEHPGPHLHFVVRPKIQDFTFAGWLINYSIITNRTSFTKNGQNVNRLQPILNIPNLQIVSRGILNWDTNYNGSVDPYRYERWTVNLTEPTEITATATTTSTGVTPIIVLLNNSGVEITRANGVLKTIQPAGNYFIQIQSDTGTGFYNLIATKSASSTGTPTASPTPTVDLTQTTATPTIDLTQTTATPTVDLTQTTATATPTIDLTKTTATPTIDLTQFPATATPTVNLTQTTATPTIDLTQTTATATATIDLTQFPVTATPTATVDLTQFPATATPTPTVDLTQFPATATPTATIDLTQFPATFTPTATIDLTQFPATATPTATIDLTQFPATATPTATIDLTQFPATFTPTATIDLTQFPATATTAPSETPISTFTPTPTVDLTQFPATATPTIDLTQFPATATPTVDLTQFPATATATIAPSETPISTITATATVTLTPTNTAIPTPSGPYVLTDVTQSTLVIDETSLVTVSLFNVPASGYASAEVTCTYNPVVLEANNITVGNLFGADSVSAVFGPQNGSFIIAVAGSNGNKATSNGAMFTFNVRGLSAGQTNVECTARVSSSGALESISFIPDSVTVLSALPSPTATAIPNATVNGQVIAGKPVTIQLFDLSNNLIASVNADASGLFNFTAPNGSYNIIASADGYLDAQGSITISGSSITMPLVNLPAGDLDGNGVIDQFDALTIGMNYDLSTPSVADLNNDGIINVLDAELLAANYRLSGALVWQ